MFWSNGFAQWKTQPSTTDPSAQLGPLRLPEYPKAARYFVKGMYTCWQSVLSIFIGLYLNSHLNPSARLVRISKDKNKNNTPNIQQAHIYVISNFWFTCISFFISMTLRSLLYLMAFQFQYHAGKFLASTSATCLKIFTENQKVLDNTAK